MKTEHLFRQKNISLCFGIFIFCAITLLNFAYPTVASALTTSQIEKYVLEKLVTKSSVTNPQRSEILAKLEYEINLMVDKGHLEPAYFEIGIMGSYLLWGNPAEQAYILSSTLPYLSTATQTKVKDFLQQEVRSNDPTQNAFEHCTSGWGVCEMTGNRREYYSLPTSPTPDPLKPNIWPPLEVPVDTIYMMWAYAENTGDWGYISTSSTSLAGSRWDRIKSLFAKIPTSPTRYGEIMGAIGYARILLKYNQKGSSDYTLALQKIANGMTAGINFRQFVDTSYASFIDYQTNHDWAFTPFHYYRGISPGTTKPVGAMFAPELGRYLGEQAMESVQKVATYNPNQDQPGEVPGVQSHWPTWYVARGSFPAIRAWVGHYGENHMATPDTPWAIFMIEAYVYNSPGEKLADYLSNPYSVGDLYFIQKATSTVQGFDEKCWRNLSTGEEICNTASVCTADLNMDKTVNQADYDIMLSSLLQVNPIADIDLDGIVDIRDYAILAGNFGKQCN